MNFTTAALLVTWVALLLLGLAHAGIQRQLRMLAGDYVARGDTAIPAGAPAPAVEGVVYGEHGTLLMFSDGGCDACIRVLAEAEHVARGSNGDGLRVVSIFPNDARQVRHDHVRAITSKRAFDEFNVAATPFAVLVGGDARVVSAAPVGSEQALHRFLSTARG